MYLGTNPTALKSQNALKDALLALLEEKPYHKISVKELCGKADVSRQTFYQLFDGTGDVVRFYLNGVFKTFLDEMRGRRKTDLKDFFIGFYFEFFSARPEIAALCQAPDMGGLLTELFAGYLVKYHNEFHKEENERLNEYAHVFLAGAMTQTLIYWMKNGMDAKTQELSSVIGNILNGKHFG